MGHLEGPVMLRSPFLTTRYRKVLTAHLCFRLFQGCARWVGSNVLEYPGQLAQKVPQVSPGVHELAHVAGGPQCAGLVAFEFDCQGALGWSVMGLGSRVFR
jgi:hypothetical protein